MKQDVKMLLKDIYGNLKSEDPRAVGRSLRWSRMMSDDVGKDRGYEEVAEFVKKELKGAEMLTAMKDRVE